MTSEAKDDIISRKILDNNDNNSEGRNENGLIRVRIPATTANIGPGFDTFGLALGYYNYISVCPSDKTTLTIKGQGEARLPVYRDNLIYRSFRDVYEKFGEKIPEISLTFENNIPLSRGLGSSAAAILGGLFTANTLLNNPLNQNDLLKMAVSIEGHSDNVTPALLGGFVVSGIFGNQIKEIKTVRFLPPKELKIIAVIPNFKLPTQKSREILPRQIPFSDAVFNLSRSSLMIAALSTGDLDLFRCTLEDRIHQPYRFRVIPGAFEVARAAKAAGALGCVLSGSGPTMLAFIAEKAQSAEENAAVATAVATSMTEAFKRRNISSRYLVLEPDTVGTCIINKS